jgi:LAS superfamily LD-carboxypeptidase LdcB
MRNGFIPKRLLMKIPGNGQLLRGGPAESWIVMWRDARRRGVNMTIWEGPIRRTYRPYSAQLLARRYWCGQGNCGNAAVPGTSNHGLGTTVDLMSTVQRRYIDNHGARFGWSKRWSDAAWEWWHIRYQSGHWRPKKGVIA